MGIIYFNNADDSFYVSEWGHSVLTKSREVGPYRCNDYLIHFNLCGTTEYLGQTTKEGQVFFIPKSTLYQFITSRNYDHYWFAFSGSRAESFLRYFGISPDKGCILDVSSDDLYSDYVRTAFEKCSEENSEQIAIATLFSLLALCKKSPDSNTKCDDVEFAAEIMDKNYYKDIRISDIASAARLEQKYFSRKFKNRFGISPIDYLSDIRIKKGCELLRENKYMIKEISFLVGYNSSLAFNRAFKRKIGISPKEYREKHHHGEL